MNLLSRNAGKKTRGQTMVEFALVLPILLVTMYGIMELGRLLFIFVTTTSAAREATRYASAVEVAEGSTVERFRDCDGIRAAASRVDALSAIQNISIKYYQDYGGPNQQRVFLIDVAEPDSCPPGGTGPNLHLGDQVVVEVTGQFNVIAPIVPINDFTIVSESARTVIKDVPLSVQVPAIAPTGTPTVSPPWTSFGGTYFFVAEDDVNYHYPNYFEVPVIVRNADGTPHTNRVNVSYRISGEATLNQDYVIRSTNPIEIHNSAGTGSINIEILDDNLYEYYERVIIYLESVDDGNIVWPSTYVLYIIDDDRIPPVVEFELPSSEILETGSPSFPINLILDKVSQRDTFVPITVISGSDPGDATLGLDFIPQNWDFVSQSTVVTIPANTYPTYPFWVDIFDDSVLEGSERVVFQLGIPLNATLGAQNVHTLTILDDDEFAHECSNYSIGTWSVSQSRMTITLSNNDPNAAPAYIRELTASWTGSPTSQTWYLQEIRFGTPQIWSGVTTSPFVSNWPTVALNRQLPVGNKDLVFATSRNGPVPTGITVTLDNGCVLSR